MHRERSQTRRERTSIQIRRKDRRRPTQIIDRLFSRALENLPGEVCNSGAIVRSGYAGEHIKVVDEDILFGLEGTWTVATIEPGCHCSCIGVNGNITGASGFLQLGVSYRSSGCTYAGGNLASCDPGGLIRIVVGPDMG
jgi:hypothetical protein